MYLCPSLSGTTSDAITSSHLKKKYLNILCKSIEDLLSHIYSFGEITLTLLINHVLPRIVPVKITDGLLVKKLKLKKKKYITINVRRWYMAIFMKNLKWQQSKLASQHG